LVLAPVLIRLLDTQKLFPPQQHYGNFFLFLLLATALNVIDQSVTV